MTNSRHHREPTCAEKSAGTAYLRHFKTHATHMFFLRHFASVPFACTYVLRALHIDCRFCITTFTRVTVASKMPLPPCLSRPSCSLPQRLIGQSARSHWASKGGTRHANFPGHVANVTNQSTHYHVLSQKVRSSTHYRAPYDRRARTGTPRHNRATPLGITTYLQPLWQSGVGSKKTEQRVAECHESTVSRAVQVSETSPSSSSSSPRVTGPAPDPAAPVPPPAPP